MKYRMTVTFDDLSTVSVISTRKPYVARWEDGTIYEIRWEPAQQTPFASFLNDCDLSHVTAVSWSRV